MWTITAPPHPDFFLRELGTENGERNALSEDGSGRAEKKDKTPIRCRTCHAPLTGKNQAISRQGRHEHAFFNPAGIAFEVRCFQDAPGCLVNGKPTEKFSWFAGYYWQFALCRNCGAHTGWFFNKVKRDAMRSDSFFTLIVRQVI